MNLTLVKSPIRTCPTGIYDYCFMGAHYFTFKCRIWFQKSGFKIFWWKLGWTEYHIWLVTPLITWPLFFSNLHTGLFHLKFSFSEKATKFFAIFFMILTLKVRIIWEGHKIWKNLPLKIWLYWVPSNFKWKILSNFVAFSEYPNFKSNVVKPVEFW